MNYKHRLIQQYNSHISSLIETGNYRSYMITTTFNMTTHVPDRVESNIISRIKFLKKNDASSPVLSELYKALRNYRFKINSSLNRRIYEKDITFKRVSFVWDQYDKLQSHLTQSLIKNAGRSGKIELHPKTFDFLDVNGSKNNNPVWDDDSTLHLHSIFLIRNEIADKFDGFVDDEFMHVLWHPNLTGIRGVHADAIGSEPENLSKAIEYSSKFTTGFDPLRTKADLALSFQYPISSSERRLRRQHAQALHTSF